ncbi:RNA polymerase sigma factor [Spirosoma gilvum]
MNHLSRIVSYNHPLPCTTLTHEHFETIYIRYASKVYQKCLAMTADPDISQDYTQDIFIKVFHKLDTFQHRSNLSTWLYSVTHNYCLDQLRSRQRRQVRSLSEEDDYTNDQEDEISLEQQFYQLHQIIETLPKLEQRLIRMRYEQGMDLQSIANQLKLKLSAVKMRLMRNRRKIQKLYNELNPQN